jgi:hypothetical protein
MFGLESESHVVGLYLYVGREPGLIERFYRNTIGICALRYGDDLVIIDL